MMVFVNSSNGNQPSHKFEFVIIIIDIIVFPLFNNISNTVYTNIKYTITTTTTTTTLITTHNMFLLIIIVIINGSSDKHIIYFFSLFR